MVMAICYLGQTNTILSDFYFFALRFFSHMGFLTNNKLGINTLKCEFVRFIIIFHSFLAVDEKVGREGERERDT